MGAIRAMRAIRAITAGAALVLTACNGWPKPEKLEIAQSKPEKYPTYQATSAEQTQVFAFDNRRWMVSPAVVDLHESKLQSVGTAGNVTVYAPAGQQSPYTVLYAPAGETKWHQVLPIE